MSRPRDRGSRAPRAERQRERAKRRGPAEPGAPPRRRAALPRRAAWIAAAAVLLLAAITLFRVFQPTALRHAGPADPAARLSPQEAYLRADELAKLGREVESLPYYRRAIEGPAANAWQLHYNYATALHNITHRPRARRGLGIPLMRSSYERVDAVRQAWREIDAAERLARDPRDRATVKALRGQMMDVWGFPWETFVAFRQAQALDPARHDITVRGDHYMRLMKSPHTTER